MVRELMDAYGLDRMQAARLLDVITAHGAVVARTLHVERSQATADALDVGVPVSTIANAVGVARSTVYEWERDNA